MSRASPRQSLRTDLHPCRLQYRKEIRHNRQPLFKVATNSSSSIGPFDGGMDHGLARKADLYPLPGLLEDRQGLAGWHVQTRRDGGGMGADPVRDSKVNVPQKAARSKRKITYTWTCQYCGQPFETDVYSQRYCNRTHREYAYLERKRQKQH